MLDIDDVKKITKGVNFTTTKYIQYGGKYEGETLTKHRHDGSPSWLIMARVSGQVVVLKWNAITIYEV